MPPYEKTVFPNQDPHYDRSLRDFLRIGSFVCIKDGSSTHIARIECRQTEVSSEDSSYETTIRLRLFHPLFKRNKPDGKKSKTPKHNFAPILSGTGSSQTELYESADLRWFCSNHHESPKSLFPAFCFTLKEMAQPKNAWAAGLFNVYICRFWEDVDYDNSGKTRTLRPLPSEKAFGFPNDHPDFKKGRTFIVPQRCLHESIWNGLHGLKRALNKLLNKRSGQASDKEVTSLNIGHIPMEAVQYISLVANYLCSVPSHPVMLSESFFHLDQSLRRSKIKITFNAGVIRFKTERELENLRLILGPGSTYGFTERRPTLQDGPQGLLLKRGHNLNVVAGTAPQGQANEERPFKRRSYENRVDFTFSPYNVRLTVGYQRYVYHLKQDGELRTTPPCPNLKRMLEGDVLYDSTSDDDRKSSEDEDDNHVDEYQQALVQIKIGAQYLHNGDSVMEVESVSVPTDGPASFTCRCVAGSRFLYKETSEKQLSIVREDIIKLLQDIKSFA